MVMLLYMTMCLDIKKGIVIYLKYQEFDILAGSLLDKWI